MLGLFRAKAPVGDDELEWMLACFAWLSRSFGAGETPLVLPTTAFFPPSDLQGHPRAAELFDQVRAHAGMQDWPCRLEPGAASRESRIAPGHMLRHHSSPPGGTFGYDERGYVITYNPAYLNAPEHLVATFAHELAHYLIHDFGMAPPGGRELEEHATDLAAVFLGFGIFMANGAKNFRQFQSAEEHGWEMSVQGYLSENALVTALALFVRLMRADEASARQALKDYLRAPFKRALAVIDRRYPALAQTIEALDPTEWQ